MLEKAAEESAHDMRQSNKFKQYQVKNSPK